ncbi:hypothetical protein MW887_002521 [Aspergillus wentii]|nr:hypothetical protein MW887_002521 [Aspergillus wentii]
MDEGLFISGGHKKYTAYHFRVSMREDDMRKHHLDAPDGLIETQVKSFTQHISAQEEHDALYKPRPEVTDVQRMALEDLKDVANFFDSAMNRLRRVEMAKETSLDNSFETPSELGIFVSS